MSGELGVPALELGGDAFDALSGHARHGRREGRRGPRRLPVHGRTTTTRCWRSTPASCDSARRSSRAGARVLETPHRDASRSAAARTSCWSLPTTTPCTRRSCPPDIEIGDRAAGAPADRPSRPHAARRSSIIYPLEELLAAKDEQLVCSRVDSHWTDYGAFLAYLRLMEDARAAGPDAQGRTWTTCCSSTSSSRATSAASSTRRARRRRPFGRMRYRNARLIYDNLVEGTGALAVTDCDVAPPTTCLLLGDSYSYVLARFLSECWRRLVLAHAPTLDHRWSRTRAARHRRERARGAVPDLRARTTQAGGRCRSGSGSSASTAARATRCCTGPGPRCCRASPVEVMRAPPGRGGPHPRCGARGGDGLRGAAPGRGDGAALVGDRRATRSSWSRCRAGATPAPRRAPCRCGSRWPRTSRPGAGSRAARAASSSSRHRTSRGASTCATGASTPIRTWRARSGIKSRLPSFLRHVFCVLLINAGAGLRRGGRARGQSSRPRSRTRSGACCRTPAAPDRARRTRRLPKHAPQRHAERGSTPAAVSGRRLPASGRAFL